MNQISETKKVKQEPTQIETQTCHIGERYKQIYDFLGIANDRLSCFKNVAI